MKRLLCVLASASLMILSFAPAYGASEITLDQVDQVGMILTSDTVLAVYPVRFAFRLTNTDGNDITCFTNGFRVWTHRHGAYTDNFDPITFDTLSHGWCTMFDLIFTIGSYGIDGVAEDTVKFGGATLFESGIPDGFDEQVWWVQTGNLVVDDTICVDSSFVQPGGLWLWCTDPGGLIPPDWYGPYCFFVAECCIGSQGNVDLQGSVTVADLTFLVGYLFPPRWPLPCTGTGNVDGVGGINVADLTYLVDYLFFDGPPPAPCP